MRKAVCPSPWASQTAHACRGKVDIRQNGLSSPAILLATVNENFARSIQVHTGVAVASGARICHLQFACTRGTSLSLLAHAMTITSAA